MVRGSNQESPPIVDHVVACLVDNRRCRRCCGRINNNLHTTRDVATRVFAINVQTQTGRIVNDCLRAWRSFATVLWRRGPNINPNNSMNDENFENALDILSATADRIHRDAETHGTLRKQKKPNRSLNDVPHMETRIPLNHATRITNCNDVVGVFR